MKLETVDDILEHYAKQNEGYEEETQNGKGENCNRRGIEIPENGNC